MIGDNQFLNFEPDLALQGTYQFEALQLKVNNMENPVHVYPSDRVKSTFKQYRQENPNDFDNGKIKLRQSVSERVSNHLNQSVSNLSTSRDTTLHYKENWLKENAVVDVRMQELRRGNKSFPLCDGKERMFVLNHKKELAIASKQRKYEHGRVHHSSLSLGKNVYAAGIIKATKTSPGKAKVVLENKSGHYQPKPNHLDRVVAYFANKKINVTTLSDQISHDSEHRSDIRTLTLECEFNRK